MQNYYARPVRYTVSAGQAEDPEWGARLVGILYLVMGGVLLITPLIKSLGVGTQIFFGIFGIPAFATRTLSLPVLVVVAAFLLFVGGCILARQGWAYFLGMATAFVLFMPSFPVGTAVGCLILYALWQGLPTGQPVTPVDTRDH